MIRADWWGPIRPGVPYRRLSQGFVAMIVLAVSISTVTVSPDDVVIRHSFTRWSRRIPRAEMVAVGVVRRRTKTPVIGLVGGGSFDLVPLSTSLLRGIVSFGDSVERHVWEIAEILGLEVVVPVRSPP
ncbi:MAG: hypothetical protein AAGE98_05400 [Actinomycetota bacterium]